MFRNFQCSWFRNVHRECTDPCRQELFKNMYVQFQNRSFYVLSRTLWICKFRTTHVMCNQQTYEFVIPEPIISCTIKDIITSQVQNHSFYVQPNNLWIWNFRTTNCMCKQMNYEFAIPKLMSLCTIK